MQNADVAMQALFLVKITEYGTREKYFALMQLAGDMEPDRVALTLQYGFVVPTRAISSVLIHIVRMWRKMHADTGVSFDDTPALRFAVEPMFTNTNRIEVVLDANPANDMASAADAVNRLLDSLLGVKK